MESSKALKFNTENRRATKKKKKKSMGSKYKQPKAHMKSLKKPMIIMTLSCVVLYNFGQLTISQRLFSF